MLQAMTSRLWRCCVQDRRLVPFLEATLHFCHVITREEPEGASRACVVGVLVASVSLAAALMPLVGDCLDCRDSAMLGWLDDAVMRLANAVVHWEGVRESVMERVLQPGVLLAWLQAFGAREEGALRGVLQLSACMAAPLAMGGRGEAAEAAAGGSGCGAAASVPRGDAAAATRGGACSQPSGDKVLASQVMPQLLRRRLEGVGVSPHIAFAALGVPHRQGVAEDQRRVLACAAWRDVHLSRENYSQVTLYVV
jgi:hypothetical protein